MKIAIRYATKFGHSEKMAKVVGNVLNVKPELVSFPLREPVDTLFLGSGVLLGKVNGAMVDFINSLNPDMVKNVVCFGSCAIIKSPVPQMKALLEAKGIHCDERDFTCKGSMGPLHAGHPNNTDLHHLRSFVEALNITKD